MSQLSKSTPKQQFTVYMCTDVLFFILIVLERSKQITILKSMEGKKTTTLLFFHFTTRSLPMENITDVEVVYMDMSPIHGLINKKHGTLEERLGLFQDCFFSKNLSIQVSICFFSKNLSIQVSIFRK